VETADCNKVDGLRLPKASYEAVSQWISEVLMKRAWLRLEAGICPFVSRRSGNLFQQDIATVFAQSLQHFVLLPASDAQVYRRR
jgi:hypothetical protein